MRIFRTLFVAAAMAFAVGTVAVPQASANRSDGVFALQMVERSAQWMPKSAAEMKEIMKLRPLFDEMPDAITMTDEQWQVWDDFAAAAARYTEELFTILGTSNAALNQRADELRALDDELVGPLTDYVKLVKALCDKYNVAID